MKTSLLVSKKLTLLGIALMLVLSGCGSVGNGSGSADKATESATLTKQAIEGGEFTFALATSPDSLDAHRSGGAVAVRVLRTIYDSLVTLAPDGSIKPWLATQWEISPDGKSYTFKLRKDVKFQDGTPFNAEAVKYNYDRVINPETKAINSQYLIKPYKSSEVIDEFTIKLNLESPSAAFLGNLSQAHLGFVSPTAAKKYGDQLGKNPVGTGPFKFIKWVENSEITVERNPDYNWGPVTVGHKGQAYLDKLTFKIIPEEATRIGSVQSGQVLAAESVPPQNVLALKNDARLQLLKSNTVGLAYSLFINQRKEPWNELKARQALQAAIDVDAIVKTLYLGVYDRAWSPLVPGIFGYDKSLENSVKTDAAKANRLLDELGWVRGADGIRTKDGKKLTLHYVDTSPNQEKRNDIAAIIQQQLKQIGVVVEVEITKDLTTLVMKNGSYDIFGSNQVNSDPNALFAFYHSSIKAIAGGNLAGLIDPQLDILLEQGAIEQDSYKRKEIYKKIQVAIIDQAAAIPIYVVTYTIASSKSVNGLKFDALGFPLFNDVYLKN